MPSHLNALNNIQDWLLLSLHQQDQTIASLERVLNGEFEHRFTRSYTKNSKLRIPTFTHVPTDIEFNLILGGSYLMGLSLCEEELAGQRSQRLIGGSYALKPPHPVQVQPFFLSRFPLLKPFAEQSGILNPFLLRMEFEDGANECVPIYLMREEVTALNAKYHFSLPSEAQWEYAYRGHTKTMFPFGDELPEEPRLEEILLDHFEDDDACLRSANGFGLVGLHVGEWCEDTYRPYYAPVSVSDVAITNGPPYVIRGGAAFFWPWQGEDWLLCLSAMRSSSDETEDNMSAARFMRRLDLNSID